MLKQPFSPIGAIVLTTVMSTIPAAAQIEANGAAPAPAAPIAAEQVGGTLLTIQPSIRYERASVRVSGPDGYALRKTVDASGSITVDLVAEAETAGPDARQANGAADAKPLEQLADGMYKYEAIFYAAGDRRVHTGRFFVEAGSAVSRAAKRSQLGGIRRDLEQTRVARQTGGDGLLPDAPQESYYSDDFLHVNDLSVDDETTLALDNDGPGVPISTYWGVANDYDSLELGRSNVPWSIDSPYLSIEVGGEVGIGTTTPTAGLHIDNAATRQVRINGFGGYESSFGIGFIGHWIYDDDGEAIAQFNHGASSGTLIVDNDGLEVNAQKINLQSASGATQVIVQENGASGRRQLFRLENNGPPEFSLVDNDRALTWKFGTRADSFEINRGGSGQTELILRANGNLDIKGVLNQGSSRAIKKDFEALDSRSILARVNELPLLEWSYKSANGNDRHFGPMAEDFHETFGLGDDPGRLSPGDTAGIALAAVQGLNHVLEDRLAEKEDEIATLRDELAELKRRVETALP